jgi:hypothetical protein
MGVTALTRRFGGETEGPRIDECKTEVAPIEMSAVTAKFESGVVFRIKTNRDAAASPTNSENVTQ